MTGKVKQGAKLVKVPLKGEIVEVIDPKLDWALAASLIALGDPRVDAVLKACGLRIMDRKGCVIWPPEDKGKVKHAVLPKKTTPADN